MSLPAQSVCSTAEPVARPGCRARGPRLVNMALDPSLDTRLSSRAPRPGCRARGPRLPSLVVEPVALNLVAEPSTTIAERQGECSTMFDACHPAGSIPRIDQSVATGWLCHALLAGGVLAIYHPPRQATNPQASSVSQSRVETLAGLTTGLATGRGTLRTVRTSTAKRVLWQAIGDVEIGWDFSGVPRPRRGALRVDRLTPRNGRVGSNYQARIRAKFCLFSR